MRNRPNAPAASTQPNGLTRREMMHGIIAMLAPGVYVTKPHSAQQPTATSEVSQVGPYDSAILPRGVRSRFINNGNGLKMHILEAGFDVAGRPCVLLLHGFPELAYSWRKVMPVLAEAGFHVVAPDLRGYGRTSGGGLRYEDDASDFLFLNEVRDILGLDFQLGYSSVSAVISSEERRVG